LVPKAKKKVDRGQVDPAADSKELQRRSLRKSQKGKLLMSYRENENSANRRESKRGGVTKEWHANPSLQGEQNGGQKRTFRVPS